MRLKIQQVYVQLTQLLHAVRLLAKGQSINKLLLCLLCVFITAFAGYKLQYAPTNLGVKTPTVINENKSATTAEKASGTTKPSSGQSGDAGSPSTPQPSSPTTPPPPLPVPKPSYYRSFAAVGASVQLLSPAQKTAANIGGWSDMSLGILRKGSDYQFYGIERSRNSSTGEIDHRQIMTTGTLDNPISKLVFAMPAITTASTGFQYLGGGPVYLDKDSQVLLQILHMERHYNGKNGSPQRTELHLGLINQTTNTTTDLGTILEPNFSYQTGLDVYNSGKRANGDMGSPSIVNPGDGYLYIYYQDYYFDAATGIIRPRPMSVARAKAVDVVAAARNGTTTPWHKYYQNSWSQPGAGGMSTSLNGELGYWPFVSTSTAFGGYVVVSPNATNKFIIASSANGLAWNAPQSILEVDSTKYSIAYPSIVGTGDDPSNPGMDFYFYYLRWGLINGAPNWNDASIMRQQVRCTATV